jgi:hypothetical protein
MKLGTFTALIVLVSASYAFAGGGAPVPAKPEAGPPAGKPGAVLDDAKCKQAWSEAAGGENELSADKAGPYVVNIEKVDINNDGKVTDEEFTQGCKGGWVQAEASKPAETGGGQTPEQPTKP